jgi:hypothetical protein
MFGTEIVGTQLVRSLDQLEQQVLKESKASRVFREQLEHKAFKVFKGKLDLQVLLV